MKTAILLKNMGKTIVACAAVIGASISFAQAQSETYSLENGSKITLYANQPDLITLAGLPAKQLYNQVKTQAKDARDGGIKGELFKFDKGILCKRQIYGQKSDGRYDEEYFCDLNQSEMERLQYHYLRLNFLSRMVIVFRVINYDGPLAEATFRSLNVIEEDHRTGMLGKIVKTRNGVTCIHEVNLVIDSYSCDIAPETL